MRARDCRRFQLYDSMRNALVLQTVHCLHVFGRLAHLEITSSNIMLRKEGYEAWDQLKLLDF